MEKVEEILRKQIADYETEYAQAEQKISACSEDTLNVMYYAEQLAEPINIRQILFWCKGDQESKDTPREIFDNLYQTYGESYEYVWVSKTNKNSPQGLPAEVKFVKKKSKAYWKALATSKYLVGNWTLPLCFVKREEQVYVNSMQGKENLWQDAKEIRADARFLMCKELWKATYCIKASDDSAKIAERLVGKGWEYPGQVESPEMPDKVLVFANWEAGQKLRYMIRYMTDYFCEQGCRTTVIAKKADTLLNDTFEKNAQDAVKMLTWGRMTLTKTEQIFLRMIEQHPVWYMEYPDIQNYVKTLMRREWKRLCGEASFDRIVLMGKLVPRVFFMIDAVQTGEKILVDDDITLPNSLEKGAETEQKVWDTFDKIYVNIASERVAEKKIRRIPIRKLRTAYAQEQMEFFTKDGEEYLIMGRWKDTQCGENLHAVKLPKGGSCLVNAENSLTLLEKEQLAEKLKNEKNIYLLGKNAADYTAIAENNCEIVDEFIFKYMYMCPQAETYFARFSRYYGRQDGKYDGLREICNIHGVELVE